MKRLFKVTTKIALFDKSKEHILVIHLSWNNDWGLPGGHIEDSETPIDAMKRELIEECGIVPDIINQNSFFIHSSGKLVLAYVGATTDTTLKSEQNESEGVPKWLTRSEFEAINIEPGYRDLVLSNWPK